jgi:hypothetical protein
MFDHPTLITLAELLRDADYDVANLEPEAQARIANLAKTAQLDLWDRRRRRYIFGRKFYDAFEREAARHAQSGS